MNEIAGAIRLVMLGAGGHAAVILDTLEASGQSLPDLILDRNEQLWGHDLFGVKIRGNDDQLGALAASGVRAFVVGIGSTRDTTGRRRAYELGRQHGMEVITVRHPRGTCSSKADVGTGLQLLAGAIVGPRTHLGVNVLVNTGAIIEHDGLIGDHVHVATGARICGNARIGSGTHIGAGATVIQGITIGRDAVVGAGAVVVRDVEDGQIVIGVPARVRRTP